MQNPNPIYKLGNKFSNSSVDNLILRDNKTNKGWKPCPETSRALESASAVEPSTTAYIIDSLVPASSNPLLRPFRK